MASNAPQNLNYTPVSVEGVIEVNGRFGGWNPIDSLRNFFTVDSQVEEGDYFMDRSRHLLDRHLQLMALQDQNNLCNRYVESVFNVCVALPCNDMQRNRTRTFKNELRAADHNSSQLQMLLRAKEYKRLSKKTYTIVKVNLYYHETGSLI
jgi:hypothetical protein